MINRLFVGFTTPRIEYIPFKGKSPDPVDISISGQVTLMIEEPLEGKETLSLKVGDVVKTGQKLALSEESDAYVISSVTGTVSGMTPFTGRFGWTATAVSIDMAETEETDLEFEAQRQEETLETISNFLDGVPGGLAPALFSNSDKPIKTIVINGVDPDLLVVTRQHVIQTRIEDLTRGIAILKKATKISDVVLVVPVDIMPGYGHIGAGVKAAGTAYPSGLPHMIMKDVLGQVVPAGKTLEDLGVACISVEAVASIGSAFGQGRIPSDKLITVISKDNSRTLVTARIGTPIRQIFKSGGIVLENMDRIICGGPMTGVALYSEDQPVTADTDAIMVQANDDLPYISDYPCINCGECIRTCPVKLPVNMLVRLLEAGQYQEAADEYDLYACLDCGLCSYVCVSRIPIFQYIKLAKYELARTHQAEAANV